MFPGFSSAASRRRLDVLAAVSCTLVVGLFLFLPGDSIDGLDGGLPWPFPVPADKAGHGVLFWIETHFLYRALRWRAGALPVAVAMSLVYAGLSEVVQLAIPMRSADALDVVADACGIAAYAAFASWIFRREASKSAAEAAEWNYP